MPRQPHLTTDINGSDGRPDCQLPKVTTPGEEATTRFEAHLHGRVRSVVGLLLPAVVITRTVDGHEQVQDLWRRSFAVRVSFRLYALAPLDVPLLRPSRSRSLCRPAEGLSVSSVTSC